MSLLFSPVLPQSESRCADAPASPSAFFLQSPHEMAPHAVFNFDAALPMPLPMHFALPPQALSFNARSVSQPLVHQNPMMLEGFSLDASAHAGEPAVGVAAPVRDSKRKRKALSIALEEELAVENDRKLSRSGKSLIDVRSSLASSTSSGSISPLLELLQQSNLPAHSSAPFALPHFHAVLPTHPIRSKEERAELRRHKSKMKLLRLEASIAQLQTSLSQTRAAEMEATARAKAMAAQAMQAAQIAQQHVQQQQQVHAAQSGMLVADASFTPAASYASSLPPLSPSVCFVLSSSSSLADGECSTPSASSEGLSSPASVPRSCMSLDEEIHAAIQSVHSPVQAKEGEGKESLESQLRVLHFAEQVRSLRTMQHAMHALQSSDALLEQSVASAPCALRFMQEHVSYGSDAFDATRDALQQLYTESRAASEWHTNEMQGAIRALTAAVLAKSRAQQSAVARRV